MCHPHLQNLPECALLERLNVRSLPTLGSLHHVELNGLAFLKAFEPVRVDRGVVHKHVLTVLTADEAKPLGIVKPLDCSLFHFDSIPWCDEFDADPNRGSTNLFRTIVWRLAQERNISYPKE